jgi:hypothetical protein
MRSFITVTAAVFMSCAVSSCDMAGCEIKVVEIRTAQGVDASLMPVNPGEVLPKGTSKVYCWFRWRDAKINIRILAKWHYVTDDIPVFSYEFGIPKKDGAGSVVLSMPEGKTLPSGSYKVDLILGSRILRSLSFRIE